MKKLSIVLFTAAAGTSLFFSSCQNVEELKTKDADAVQALVDSKIEALNMSLDSVCQANVDSMATVAYAEWVAANSKAPSKKVTTKKPTTPSTPSTPTVGNGKPSMKNETNGTVGNGKPTMKNESSGTVGNGKPSFK